MGVVSKQVADDWALALKRVGRGVTEATVEVMLKKLDNDTAMLVKAAISIQFLMPCLARSNNAFPVVIIFEANAVLGRGKNDSEIILQDLVARTKHDMELSLILAASEHAYPYQLEREGLNMRDVTIQIFAGEIPLSDMWKLLVNATYEQGAQECSG
jgi:hypothetical protein